MIGTADLGALPEGPALMSTCTSTDTTRAVRLWQCPSREVLEGCSTKLVGDDAVNDVFEVSERSVIVAGQGAPV